MNVIALDPGGTTGVAVYRPQLSSPFRQYQIDTSSPAGLYEVSTDLKNYAGEVVSERFEFRYGSGRAKVVLTPVEVIGVVKLFCFANHRNLFLQTPSQAKKFITDDKIRRLDLWIPSQPHAMDATRHLLYHLIVTKHQTKWLERLKQNQE